MKSIFRMLLFSGLALYATSLWNKGFLINGDWKSFFVAAAAVAIVYFIIVPVSRIILIPLNFLTLGLMSTLFSLGIIYGLDQYLSMLTVKAWVFQGAGIWGLSIPKLPVGYIMNLVLSSASLSVIINVLRSII